MDLPVSDIMVPLVDLFRNYKLEIQYSLSELKRLFEVFNLSPIVNTTPQRNNKSLDKQVDNKDFERAIKRESMIVSLDILHH